MNETLEKQYLTAKDLQRIIPNLSYNSALKLMDTFIAEEKKLGYLNPSGKTKVALTWLIKKKLGMK